MIKSLVRANLIRRFTHTKYNPNICQNNKIIEQLVEQNKNLKNIDTNLELIFLNTGIIAVLTVIKLCIPY